jgi:hypothetical protein
MNESKEKSGEWMMSMVLLFAFRRSLILVGLFVCWMGGGYSHPK